MCLNIDKKETERIKKLFKENGGKLVMYKALLPIDRYRNKMAPVEAMFTSPFRPRKMSYQAGWNHSDREKIELYNYEIDENAVDFGIHVYVDEDNGIVEDHSKKFPIDVFIPVVVYEEDFVCAGNGHDAVFMKIFIEEEEFEKALVEGQKKLESID